MNNDNVEEIKRQVEKRLAEEARAVADLGGSENEKDNVSSSFVRQCLQSQELGDGWMYAKLLKDKFVYNNMADEWMRWRGHSWERDEMNFHLAAVETVTNRYADEIAIVGEEISEASRVNNNDKARRLESIQKSLIRRVCKLRNDPGRNACVKFSRTISEPIAISGLEFDKHPELFTCSNGVINLETGVFRDGRPEDYIQRSSPVEWMGFDAPADKWERFLNEIFEGDKDLIAFVQRLFGYVITGYTEDHFFVIAFGEGRNGKEILVETISYVMGSMAEPIQSEMLLAHKNPRNAAGPSPDITGLLGLRLAYASEVDEHRRFSAGKVKWLTGGGNLTGRNLNEKYNINFEPTHKLVMMTNYKPSASAYDFAFWERVLLVPFKLRFVKRKPQTLNERPARFGIKKELKSQAPGILAWLVKGYLEYKKQGLNPPDIVTKAVAEYRRDEDLLADFIDECCFLGDHLEIKSKEIYDSFAKWYEINVSKNILSQRRFGDQMGKRFNKRKSAGLIIYEGVALNEGIPTI